MLNTLIKKQLTEIFRMYFYDEKKNKSRSKMATIMYILMFALLMIVLIGGIFTGVSLSICEPLAQLNVGWMYFIIMGSIGILLGAFGSIFNTYSGLYLSKDNDLLFSLPIPTNTIIASRLCTVYLMGLMYSAVVVVPAVIVYWIKGVFSIGTVIGGILLILLVSLFVLGISCLLGYVVAKISQKLKYKSFIVVIVSVVFIAAYYFVYFKAQQLISELVQNAIVYGEKIKGAAYILYLFGRIGEGDLVAILAMSLFVIAFLAITYVLISKTFIDISTSSENRVNAEYKETKTKSKSLSSTLFSKELNKFISSPNYMLNCGLGILVLPIVAGVFLFKGSTFVEIINEVFGTDKISVLVVFIICMMAAMNDMVAPSISLEGKNIWIPKSLPIDTWDILKSKLRVQILLTGVPVLLCVLSAIFILKVSLIETILVILIPLIYTILSAFLGLILGVSMPNLNWTNEIYPIKQSLPVTIALFGGWVYSCLGIVIYMWKLYKFGAVAYLSGILVLEIVLAVGCYYWLRNKGTELFDNL